MLLNGSRGDYQHGRGIAKTDDVVSLEVRDCRGASLFVLYILIHS